MRVAIVGAGATPFSSITPQVSYKEMMFEAARAAYNDCGIDPRHDVGSFITCAEDFWEGTSIFDEYVPDQLGGALRPVCTISGDGIHGLATAFMHIKTGLVDCAVVEAHSKLSDVLFPLEIHAFALDPILNRPLRENPYFVAGLEMRRFMSETGTTREQVSSVVKKNRGNALHNPYACYGGNVESEDVSSSGYVCSPLRSADIPRPADGAIVLVLASEEKARELTDEPVFVEGVGWCNDSPTLESREWGKALYAKKAGRMAFDMAGIAPTDIGIAEIDDSFSYKELQHLEALGFMGEGEAGAACEEGLSAMDGPLPVNTSGGTLGMGYCIEAAGLQRVFEIVTQLRGEAGVRQVEAEYGLASGWRGIPTTSGAVVICGVGQ